MKPGVYSNFLMTCHIYHKVILFHNKQHHQKLKHDCNEYKVGGVILFLSKTITIYLGFTLKMASRMWKPNI